MNAHVRIGLLRLVDSAPVVMAHALGFFRDEGIDAELEVSPSWANIADGLTWRGLDAAAIFPPLAIMTMLGRRGAVAPLRVLGALSRGGNTLVLRGDNQLAGLWPSGSQGRACFDRWAARIGRRPRIAVVHGYSTHFLLLRRFLLGIGKDILTDIELVILPPPDTLPALRNGEIDGACVGAPWGTEAALEGTAFIAGCSTSIVPGHLEKIVVGAQIDEVGRLRNARLWAALERAIGFCRRLENVPVITDQLALPVESGGLALPARAVETVLNPEKTVEPVVFGGAEALPRAMRWTISDMHDLKWLKGDEMDLARRMLAPTEPTEAPESI